jgi:hypothetical protein
VRRRLKLYSWFYILGWLVAVPVLMGVLLSAFVHFDGGPAVASLAPPREQIARMLPPAPPRPAAERPGPMVPSPETQLVAVPARFLTSGARPQLIAAPAPSRPGSSAGTRTLRSDARRRRSALGTEFALQPLLPFGSDGSTSLRAATTAPAAGAAPAVATAPTPQHEAARPAPAGTPDTSGNPDRPGNPDKPSKPGKPDKPQKPDQPGKPDQPAPASPGPAAPEEKTPPGQAGKPDKEPPGQASKQDAQPGNDHKPDHPKKDKPKG